MKRKLSQTLLTLEQEFQSLSKYVQSMYKVCTKYRLSIKLTYFSRLSLGNNKEYRNIIMGNKTFSVYSAFGGIEKVFHKNYEYKGYEKYENLNDEPTFRKENYRILYITKRKNIMYINVYERKELIELPPIDMMLWPNLIALPTNIKIEFFFDRNGRCRHIQSQNSFVSFNWVNYYRSSDFI